MQGGGKGTTQVDKGLWGEGAWEPKAQEGHAQGRAFSFSCHKQALQSVSRRDRICFVMGEAPVGCSL